MKRIKIGLVGKPNVGKSTIFSAITKTHAEIGNYPFTTVKPNLGVTFIDHACPEKDLGHPCNPREGTCRNGIRMIPVEIIDVPGLIPGASEGKGMGNEFLDNIRDVDAIIHVYDASGKTTADGNPSETFVDPAEELKFIREELVNWVASRLGRDWEKFSRKADSTGERIETKLMPKVGTFGLREQDIETILLKEAFPAKLSIWTSDDFMDFASAIFKYVKPLIHVGNKSDELNNQEMSRLANITDNNFMVSGIYELALARASGAGLIRSTEVPVEISLGLKDAQKDALARINAFFQGGIPVRIGKVISDIVYRLLHYIVVFPVYDEGKWCDKDGNVLPDAFLVHAGNTALDLAFNIHTEIGEGFIRAINGRTKMVVGKEYELKDGDVIKIVTHRT
ncbi:MAG: YchF-related putative GTPase [Thermoplasmataceae archaeon]